MKKITIEINKDLLNGLNNAVVAYGDIVYSILLGCEIPNKFKKLEDLPQEELNKRYSAIKNLYLKIEKEFEGVT